MFLKISHPAIGDPPWKCPKSLPPRPQILSTSEWMERSGGGRFFFSKIFGDATNKMSVATKLQTMIFMAEQNSFG